MPFYVVRTRPPVTSYADELPGLYGLLSRLWLRIRRRSTRTHAYTIGPTKCIELHAYETREEAEAAARRAEAEWPKKQEAIVAARRQSPETRNWPPPPERLDPFRIVEFPTRLPGGWPPA